jgi:hypothetical protein
MTIDLPVLIVLGCALSVFSLGLAQMLAGRALSHELQSVSRPTDLRHDELDQLGFESATPYLGSSATQRDLH